VQLHPGAYLRIVNNEAGYLGDAAREFLLEIRSITSATLGIWIDNCILLYENFEREGLAGLYCFKRGAVARSMILSDGTISSPPKAHVAKLITVGRSNAAVGERGLSFARLLASV
jgi:hypothetical protein